MRFTKVTVSLLSLLAGIVCQSVFAGALFSGPVPYQPRSSSGDLAYLFNVDAGTGYQDEATLGGLTKITFYGNKKTPIKAMKRYVDVSSGTNRHAET